MKDSHIMKPNQFSRLSHFTTLALVTALAACGGGGSSSPGPASLTLTVERIDGPGLSAIQGTLHIARTGAPVLGASLTVAASSGTLSATQDLGAGDYRFLVTPDRTGEYRLDITFEGQVLTRTALVLGEVDGAWGQPMAVEGLVNTPGYEDGVTITPDGEYLFVQYGPWRFSAVELFKTSRAAGGAGGDRLVPSTFNHPWIDTTIGPTGAPERPGLFDGRFSGTALLHNSNLWGIPIDGTSNFAAITMFYGFKRQPDGSYREPFYLAFEDENDAIMNPFGLSFRMDGGDQATVLFSLDDPSDPVLVRVSMCFTAQSLWAKTILSAPMKWDPLPPPGHSILPAWLNSEGQVSKAFSEPKVIPTCISYQVGMWDPSGPTMNTTAVTSIRTMTPTSAI
jgi:hypothetical protein